MSCKLTACVLDISPLLEVEGPLLEILITKYHELQKTAHTLWLVRYLVYMRTVTTESIRSLTTFIEEQVNDSSCTLIQENDLLSSRFSRYTHSRLAAAITAEFVQKPERLDFLVDEVFTPFVLICTFIRDHRLLSTDQSALICIRTRIEQLLRGITQCCIILSEFVRAAVDTPVDANCENSSMATKELQSSELITQLETFFEAYAKDSKCPVETHQVSEERKNAPTASEPQEDQFESMLLDDFITLFTHLPVVNGIIKRHTDASTAPQWVNHAIVCFLLHIAQKPFLPMLLTLVGDRLHHIQLFMAEGKSLVMGVESASPSSSETDEQGASMEDLYERLFACCKPATGMHHHNITTTLKQLLDFVAKCTQSSLNTDIDEGHFDKPLDFVPSWLLLPTLSIAHAPWYTHLQSFEAQAGEEAPAEPQDADMDTGAPITVDQLAEALQQQPMFEYSDATGYDESQAASGEPRQSIQWPMSFYESLEAKVDTIYAAIMAENPNAK